PAAEVLLGRGQHQPAAILQVAEQLVVRPAGLERGERLGRDLDGPGPGEKGARPLLVCGEAARACGCCKAAEERAARQGTGAKRVRHVLSGSCCARREYRPIVKTT